MTTGFHALHVTGGLFAFIFLLARTHDSPSSPPPRPPARSSSPTTGTSSTWSGSACSPSSTSSVRGRPPAGHDAPMTTTSRRGAALEPRTPGRRRWPALCAGLALLAAAACTRCSPRQPQRAAAGRRRPLVGEGQRAVTTTPASPATARTCRAWQDRGPSLIGVGEAAVYFQVSTGRMPLARQEAAGRRASPLRVRPGRGGRAQLGAFVRPTAAARSCPRADERCAAGTRPRGGELFRLNCASCHNFTGRGGALSSGKSAPTLDAGHRPRIYAAMLTGPENMPVFSDQQLSPEQKPDDHRLHPVQSTTTGTRSHPPRPARPGVGGPDHLGRRHRR